MVEPMVDRSVLVVDMVTLTCSDNFSHPDVSQDSRPRVGVTLSLNTSEATLNVIVAEHVPLLTSLSEGGMQHLLAGIRANVGVKAGRYMFEVKIVEKRDAEKVAGVRTPAPWNLLRIGFSTVGSSTLLDDPTGGFYFDSEGFNMTGELLCHCLVHHYQHSSFGSSLQCGRISLRRCNLDPF